MLDTQGEVRKVLIVRTSALGDVVHALPSLEALRTQFPKAQIHWLVEPLSARLLESHPALDRVILLERQKWKKLLRSPLRWPSLAAEIARFGQTLRRERYDVVIDFHGNLRTLGLRLLAGGRHRLGFHRHDVAEAGGSLFTTHRAPRQPLRQNKVEKDLALVRELGFDGPCPRGRIQLSPSDRAWARSLLEGLPGSGPAVALHPAVSRFGEIKRWPAESFRALIDALRSRHDARILITWGPGERRVAEAVGRPTLLPAEVSLQRFAAVLEGADLVVAADTGALPIAAILGTPTVGLYGPKDPVVYAPFPVRGEVVTSNAPCSPCLLRECEHRICMATLAPQAVLAAAERALARGRASA
jgi:heptosyltransferase-1